MQQFVLALCQQMRNPLCISGWFQTYIVYVWMHFSASRRITHASEAFVAFETIVTVGRELSTLTTLWTEASSDQLTCHVFLVYADMVHTGHEQHMQNELDLLSILRRLYSHKVCSQRHDLPYYSRFPIVTELTLWVFATPVSPGCSLCGCCSTT